MNVDALLITKPAIDFKNLLAISHQALGFSPAAKSDSSRRDLSDSERYLSCLAAMSDPEAPVGLASHLLAHISFSVLIAVEQFDLLEVIKTCSGMPVVPVESRFRNLYLAILHGNLQQWKDAVIAGCRLSSGEPRELFCKIMGQFESNGVGVWNDFNKRYDTDNATFYLEHRK